MTSKKVLDAARYLWGDEAATPEKAREIQSNYEGVKDRYRTRSCPQCGRRDSGLAWSPVALFDMAKAVGLDRYAFYAYTLPLLQSHPSVKGTIGRPDGDQEDQIGWGERVDRAMADRVLATAHALLLHLLAVQIERFKIDGLETLAATAAEDYAAIWTRKGPDDDEKGAEESTGPKTGPNAGSVAKPERQDLPTKPRQSKS